MKTIEVELPESVTAHIEVHTAKHNPNLTTCHVVRKVKGKWDQAAGFHRETQNEAVKLALTACFSQSEISGSALKYLVQTE